MDDQRGVERRLTEDTQVKRVADAEGRPECVSYSVLNEDALDVKITEKAQKEF